MTHNGRSSFEQTEQALSRLAKYPSVFAGVIAVVDPSTSAAELFEYFDKFSIPRLDFLLPDAHWLRPPPGRNQNPGLYEEWLVDAFDIWFDQYAHIPLRTFEALLDVCAGLPSSTDAFGFGDVSLLSIETDGSYHDLDVLKVTQNGATKLGGSVSDTRIAQVACSPAIEQHRRYLRKSGLSATCQSCSIVEICGGGSLPHRFNGDGFTSPTVYCNEMKRLVTHIRNRLTEHVSSALASEAPVPLPAKFELASFELAETSNPHLIWLLARAKEDAAKLLHESLRLFPNDSRAVQLNSMQEATFEYVALHPGALAWSNAALAQNRELHVLNVEGHVIEADPDYLEVLVALAEQRTNRPVLDVGRNDLWLRAPFGKAIIFEDDELKDVGRSLVDHSMGIIREWRPDLADEIFDTCRAVQFVRDPSADPRKIVSFSDNSVPGTLYVSISQGNELIDPYDLADSLIHEHRHQKLYLLERHAPTMEPTSAEVVSPWREDLRPPSGLLHAVFVFVELRRFWLYVRDFGPANLKSRAISQLNDTDLHLVQAFATLKECPLTEIGQKLVDVLNCASKGGSQSHENTCQDSASPIIT